MSEPPASPEASEPAVSGDATADGPMRSLFTDSAKRQRWLDVEAALARAEAEAGIIPHDAAEQIAASARLEQLDYGRILEGVAATGHTMVPLVAELAHAAGPEHGGWVHWGATTQNVQQSGDTVGIREAHRRLSARLTAVVRALAGLADGYADTPPWQGAPTGSMPCRSPSGTRQRSGPTRWPGTSSAWTSSPHASSSP